MGPVRFGPAPLVLFRVEGPNAAEVLQDVLSCDVRALQPGRGALSCLLSSRGTMVAFLYLHRRDRDFLLCIPPERVLRFDPIMRRYFSLTDCFWGEEENSVPVFFQNLSDVSVPPLPFPVVEVSDRLLGAPGKLGLWSRSGGGNESLESLALPLGATWMTSEDFETMRVEGGVPKWGVDVGEDVSPLEISLDAYCDAGKGCYVGQEVVARWRKAGRAPRALMGFRLPRGASAPLDVFCRGAVVGKLTSVVRSPRSGSPLGLAFLPVEVAASPDPLTVRLPEGESPWKRWRCRSNDRGRF